VSQQTTNHSFDDLARALAEGSISRRGALKLLAGTALAALIPSRALAGDDDECVRICHVPFDRETGECDFDNARTRCVSRRERRRHLENHPCDCRGSCRNCLTPEICTPGPEICPITPCGPFPNCVCVPTTEGETACIEASCGDPCNSSDDCPAGAVCGLVSACCGGVNTCLVPCGTLASSSSAVQESSKWGAPQA
jgi:hypothetical protein